MNTKQELVQNIVPAHKCTFVQFYTCTAPFHLFTFSTHLTASVLTSLIKKKEHGDGATHESELYK